VTDHLKMGIHVMTSCCIIAGLHSWFSPFCVSRPYEVECVSVSFSFSDALKVSMPRWYEFPTAQQFYSLLFYLWRTKMSFCLRAP